MRNKYDFRDVIFKQLYEIMSKDKNVILLTNDMGALGVDRIKEKFTNQFINVGIAEQNIIGLASGLASTGYKVIIYGIISHIIFRSLEQIKLDICLPELPVTLIGIGSGLSYGNDGPTHHAVEDIGIMRILPNINIFNPSDSISAKHSLIYSINNKKPSFIRLDKEKLTNIYKSINEIKRGFKIHGNNSEGLIISTGFMIRYALEIQNKLKIKNINVSVMDIIHLNPINKSLTKIIKNYKWIIFIDEAFENGSLIEILHDSFINKKYKFVKSFNLGSKYFFGSATRKYVFAKRSISVKKIVNFAIKNIKI